MALRDGMKILILSCNTGEGHNSSGKALQTALISRGVECDIEDTLALRSKHFSKAISELYELSIKTALFGWAYRLAERYSTLQLKIKSPVDFVIVHSSNPDTHIQVRGRVNGDLQTLFLPTEGIPTVTVPDAFLGKQLFIADKDALIQLLDLRNPANNRPSG